MKMHSYITTNGYLKTVSDHSHDLLGKLKQATLSVGGWEQATLIARVHSAQLEESSETSNANVTPDINPDGTSISYVDPPTAAALRKRLVAVSSEMSPEMLVSSTSTPNETPANEFNVHALVDHPDAEIAALAREITELDSELTSSGPRPVKWPENITYRNFADYQLIPTLVYELEYPRTTRFVVPHRARPKMVTDFC